MGDSESKRETLILRNWLMWLWSLASLKSAGQLAAWRPKEELMFQFKSKGCLPIEFLSVGKLNHCSIVTLNRLNEASTNGLALLPTMGPQPVFSFMEIFSQRPAVSPYSPSYQCICSWVPIAGRVQGHLKRFSVPLKLEDVTQHLFKTSEHFMTVSKSPVFCDHLKFVCFVHSEKPQQVVPPNTTSQSFCLINNHSITRVNFRDVIMGWAVYRVCWDWRPRKADETISRWCWEKRSIGYDFLSTFSVLGTALYSYVHSWNSHICTLRWVWLLPTFHRWGK